ncbi:MAG: TonB-dependent receptor [Polaromonas sp.]|uniref:TonB-dependent receptor domain-containing protein n=1 Tax=Polaromonas sp. TaxID=1869339 RepID=UPI002730A733|nr:TonB-dependent receptor [Polaromonas sp.]MDP2256802.1 TonB-dependent receptor [Polaromonas sp.]
MKICVSRARLAVLPLALAAAFPSFSQAQDTPQLKETVVTATRTPTPMNAVLADVVVIDREAIEQSGGRTLSELLVREAGVQLSSNGGLGKAANLYIRGTESRHVLLLVDGVRYGSATLGTPNWDNIPLEQIERIEVLKGPASALYGSDAVGGVVQVFTRQGKPGLHPYASVTLGAESHYQVTAGVSGGTEAMTYSLGASVLDEKGFSATNSRVPFGSHNPDRDGFEQRSLNASMAWKLAPGWRLNAHALGARGDSQFDNGPSVFDVTGETTTQVLGAGLERQWQPGVRTSLKVSRSEDLTTNFRSTLSTTRFDTTRNQTSLQHELDSVLGTWLLGVESVKESVESTTVYDVSERTVKSVFAGLQGQRDAHSWQVNIRNDENSQFGSASTGFVGYGYQLAPAWRVHGGYGTTFKAPTFNQLYYPGYGKATTQPEKGKNSEVGVTYSAGVHQAKLTRFENRIRGYINSQTTVSNIPKVQIDGWSLGYKGGAGLWAWQTNIELLDARNVSNGVNYGRKLARRADTQLNASVHRNVSDWTLGAHLLAASDRFEDNANTQRLGGYGVVDLSAERALSPDWRLQLRLNNVGDKAYETALGYNQSGRGAFVTLRWQPK